MCMTSNISYMPSRLNNDANAIVAGNIRAEIGRAGINQDRLAVELGVTPMWLSRRLRGSTDFSTTEIQAIADYFGVTAGDLFTRHERKLPLMDSNHQPAG